MSKMFPFITATWNPLGGECLHKCSYCWATALKTKYPPIANKYSGKPHLIDKELNHVKSFKEYRLVQNELTGKYEAQGDFVFVCDMTDLFGHWVPSELINKVLALIKYSPAKFLLLTKNPARYKEFVIPKNCVLGATIESDIDYELTGPPVLSRFQAMASIYYYEKMLSIEPVMEFTPDFQDWIFRINPSFVAVGYDNYNHGLTEPELEDVESLISGCINRGITVYRKTLREKLASVGVKNSA